MAKKAIDKIEEVINAQTSIGIHNIMVIDEMIPANKKREIIKMLVRDVITNAILECTPIINGTDED